MVGPAINQRGQDGEWRKSRHELESQLYHDFSRVSYFLNDLHLIESQTQEKATVH
jgi:hypothetical protein